MTGLEPILISAGVSAGTAGTIASVAGTLGTIASVGSTLFGVSASNKESAGEIESTRYNAATERITAAQQESKLRREQYLRGGSQLASGAAQGRGISGNILDIMADTAYQNELDILGLRTSTQMSQQLSQSKIKNIKSSRRLTTASGILTGVTKLATGGVV